MRTSTQIEGYYERQLGLAGKQITPMNPETKNEYFSMDAVILENERPTTLFFEVARVGCRRAIEMLLS